MIKTFSGKETEMIWNGTKSRKMPVDIQNVARKKLRMINNAQNINDLRIPPVNRLEKLSGDLEEFYRIRINKNGESFLIGRTTTHLMWNLLIIIKQEKQ